MLTIHSDNGLLFPGPEVLKQHIVVSDFVGRSQNRSPINSDMPQINQAMSPNQGREILTGPSTTGNGQYSPGYIQNPVKHKDLFSQRKQREFTPDNKKDDSYWDRRRRNNEAAKRSREKRRYNDMILEKRVVELTKENAILKAQLEAIKDEYGICGENVVSVEKILASLSTNEQVISLSKRQKITHPTPPLLFTAQSPIPTPVIRQPIISPASPHPLPQEHQEYNTYAFQSYHPSVHYESNHALNLSARPRSRPQSPYEVMSNSGDESSPVALTTHEVNNSLPLKLRHKSHLGDKAAATALLSLQNIKQEPCLRASPSWDSGGSSDERDSGISLGAEWSAAAQAATTLQTLHSVQRQSQLHAMQETQDIDRDAKQRLHSEIVRLSTEVAHLESMIRKENDVPINH